MRKPRPWCARFPELTLTELEDRSVPVAGLNVSLSGGILRVVDWRAGDAVTLHQTAASVTLDATGDHESFAGVTRIVLDVQSDARVVNDTSGLGGAHARDVYMTRRNPSGSGFSFAGNLAAGATSGPTAPTTPTTPTPPQPPVVPQPDWFDAAVTDPTLRTLTRSLAADGTLDRSDWLKLFGQVENDGTVSAAEVHDLDDLLHPDRVTFTTTVGFTLPDAVRVLADKVVDGDPANAHYQGTGLGNLQAGSPAGTLQKLVGKWFLGTDHPQADGTYRTVNGSLFVNGPSDTDVKQGNVGDCYFVAALADVALDSPRTIQQMFTDNGDGTFTVKLYHDGRADYVTVDRSLPTTAAGTAVYASFGGRFDSGANELWVALAEKAYAQANESGWLGRPAANSYAGIDGGYSDLVLEQVTGGSAGWQWVQNAGPTALINAVAAHKATVLASRPDAGSGLVPSHGYALVGYNTTTGKFTLYNPWGSTVEVTWAQILQNFYGWWQVT